MTTDRETTRIVRSWLEEGATRIPDRVLDRVLDQLPATPQRRAWWQARRITQMNSAMRLVAAATVVLVVAFVGLRLLPAGSEVGGPPAATPTTAPTPTQAPTPEPEPIGENRTLDPETTYLVEFPGAPYTIRVPEGWEVGGGEFLRKDPPGTSGDATMTLNAWPVTNVYLDPCRPGEGQMSPPVGPGVDDLAAALSAQFAGDGSVSDVTIDGLSGKQVELSVPDDLVPSACNQFEIGRWTSPGGTRGNGGYILGPGQHDTVYILDVQGERVVIHASYLPATPEADRADLQAIIDTIDFLP